MVCCVVDIQVLYIDLALVPYLIMGRVTYLHHYVSDHCLAS